MKHAPDFDHLYDIAEGQAGYFTASQAESAGFSRERLSNTVKSGKFQRAAHGVYRLTHFPASQHEDSFIAWLVTGPNSVIEAKESHILLDILVEDNPYPLLQEAKVEAPLLLTEGECTVVTYPTAEHCWETN